jgi:hypothetical protein
MKLILLLVTAVLSIQSDDPVRATKIPGLKRMSAAFFDPIAMIKRAQKEIRDRPIIEVTQDEPADVPTDDTQTYAIIH